MTDDELHRELAALGLDRETYRAVLLLPLVQVAWADGAVQAQERELILRVAGDNGLLDGNLGAVLRRWLDQAPTADQIHRGQQLLVALTYRHRGLGADLGPGTLATVEGLCTQVAKAAGGVFGVLFSVDASERRVLDTISRELGDRTQSLLDDLPSPEGGDWADLDEQLP